MNHKILRIITILMAVFVFSESCQSAPLNLLDENYNYKVIDQDVRAAFMDFGANLGIKIDVDANVRGRIQGSLSPMKPRMFLDYVCNLFGLDWYYDGQVLFISNIKDRQTRFLVLGSTSLASLQENLVLFDISDERFTVKAAPDSKVAFVSGPPRFVQLVEQNLTALTSGNQSSSLVELKHAPLTVFRGANTTILPKGKPQ